MTINIDPIIFRLGGFSIGWYGVIIGLAIIAAFLVATREAGRKGIDRNHLVPLVLWVVAAGFVGARLFHVMENLDYFGTNPGAIFAIHRGGLAIWGGVTGGPLAVVVYSRLKGLPLARMFDMVAPALLTGQIIGRVACIINGDAWGGPTGLPWGFVYLHPDSFIPLNLWGIPTHPYPVYEMLWNLTVLLFLWSVRKRLKTDGLLIVNYVFFYSLGRLLLSYFRQQKIWFWGLQEAQVVALLALTVSIPVMLYLLARRERSTRLSPL